MTATSADNFREYLEFDACGVNPVFVFRFRLGCGDYIAVEAPSYESANNTMRRWGHTHFKPMSNGERIR